MLQAGARVADGQLPYRDFYANYGPGQYYLLGALDWLSAPRCWPGGWCACCSTPAIAVLAYALVRRDAPEPLALAAWLAVAAAMALPEPSAPQPLGSGPRVRRAAARAPRAGRGRSAGRAGLRVPLRHRHRGDGGGCAGRRRGRSPRRRTRRRRLRARGRGASPALRRRRPGGVLGPDLRLCPRPAVSAAPAAAGRVRGRVRAQQDAAALCPLSAPGRRGAVARGRAAREGSRAAVGAGATRRGGGRLPARPRRRLPPGPARRRPARAAGHAGGARAARGPHASRRFPSCWCLPSSRCRVSTASESSCSTHRRWRRSTWTWPTG